MQLGWKLKRVGSFAWRMVPAGDTKSALGPAAEAKRSRSLCRRSASRRHASYLPACASCFAKVLRTAFSVSRSLQGGIPEDSQRIAAEERLMKEQNGEEYAYGECDPP